MPCHLERGEHDHGQDDQQCPGHDHPGESDQKNAKAGEERYNGERYRIWAHGIAW